jgi:hypothetical protein
MRMGGTPVRGSQATISTEEKNAPFLNPIRRPRVSSSSTLIVGRVSSNIVESTLTPLLLDLAVSSVETYADNVLIYEQQIIFSSVNCGGLNDDIEGETVGDAVKCFPPPLACRLFATQNDVDEMASLLFDTSFRFSFPSNEWRVFSNAAKFERLLDERYGRLRPFVTSYPKIEAFVRTVGRKYAMGSLSPFRKGEGPLNRSTAIMALFIMHRQGVRVDAMILMTTFCLVGLQPWALVTLVALGKWKLEKKKGLRVHGMPGRLVSCEPYYAQGVGDCAENCNGQVEESEEEERLRKYAILNCSVPGTRFNPADLSLRDEVHDVLLLGSGVETLFPAALLARAGRKVCVLSPAEDVSGCVIMDCTTNSSFSNVPFDIMGFNFADISHQQSLLAPALCTTSDVQGGIRFARVGSDRDGYAHSVLSVPGLGTNGGIPDELTPVAINSGGPVALAQYCSTRLGDGLHSTDSEGADDVDNSASMRYVMACCQINEGCGDFYLSKLVHGGTDQNSYLQASLLTASTFLNKCLPLNPHIRSLMAAIGMPSENLSPENTSMAAHVTNLCSMLSEEGMAYPVGGPRALCHALASVIKQCDGRVVGGVILEELLFDMPAGTNINTSGETKDDGGDASSPNVLSLLKPRCRGVRLQNGGKVKVSEGSGAVLSTLGFIPTFMHLIPPDVRAIHGVPPGFSSVSERRPLMKMLVGLNGTKEELDLNGADWYRLPNSMFPATGQVMSGSIGANEFDGIMGMVSQIEESEKMIPVTNSKLFSAPIHNSRKCLLSKFTSGLSWMKVSFPSAKDPSWFDRYGAISTCVVTIEADDNFVQMFDAKPRISSIINKDSGTVVNSDLSHLLLKDLYSSFPQLKGEI